MSEREPELREPVDLFVYELEAVYDMERKLVDALDGMSRRVENDNLEKGFALHRTETETQIERVEAAFEALDADPAARENRLVDGLLAETATFDDSVASESLRNRYYLTAARTTERIEITAYEGLLETAEAADLGDDVTGPLADNLGQERKTLRKLEGLAAGSGGRSFWDVVTGLGSR